MAVDASDFAHMQGSTGRRSYQHERHIERQGFFASQQKIKGEV